MPKMATGYHTAPDGTVTQQEMYVGDLNKAVQEFPKEWSRNPKGVSAANATKAKKVKRVPAKKPAGKKSTKPEFKEPDHPNKLGTPVTETAPNSP